MMKSKLKAAGEGPSQATELSRELRCLYRASILMEEVGSSLDEVFRQVLKIVPEGMSEGDSCEVRIEYKGREYTQRAFVEKPWTIKAPIVLPGGRNVGSLDVTLPPSGDSSSSSSAFHTEEAKLAKHLALKLGRRIQQEKHRKSEIKKGRSKEGEVQREPGKAEWRVILDVLRETDGNLWKRILRRLMNHLSKMGVPGVHHLILQFDPGSYTEQDRETRGANQPLPKRDQEIINRFFESIISIADIVLPADEIPGMLKQWMRQDKLGFFALATEKRNISLIETRDIVNRVCRAYQEGEPALSPSDDRNVRVALTRRFLTDRLSFIQVAKEHLTIHDFGRLFERVAGPAKGYGKLGGKTSGIFLAEHILKRAAKDIPLLANIKVPKAWYLTSDGLFDFVQYNSLEDTQSLKYATLEEVRQGYPYLEQTFKHSYFSPEMLGLLKIALDDLGKGPLIVRSSSLLEDNEGSAFSGKYRSLFLANTGSKKERLAALTDAIAEVYASIFAPDPILYRREKGLLDFMEEMGIIIQRVVGTRVGKYFFPAVAGVAFSQNEFRWSPRIKREDGVLRIVTGLGTRAVDRVGDDYPLLVSPGQPGLRVNVTPEQVLHYAQRYVDVLNLETGKFETVPVKNVIQEVGERYPILNRIFSVNETGTLKKAVSPLLDPSRDDLVVTFSSLVEDTDFVKEMREILRVLQEAVGVPVDLEFAHDGQHLYILQCRPQSRAKQEQHVPVPWIPRERKVFSTNRFVSTAQVKGIRYVVYIDPDSYSSLESMRAMGAVGEAVSRLNAALPKRSFILMGPGRWGSRGDISLGVRVTYADISNTLMLIEMARKKGDYVPDLSFGTHFFQDLVEADIRYLALYPDEPNAVFNRKFLQESPNLLPELLPEYAHLQQIVRVIDVPAVSEGQEMQIIMDGEKDEALAFLAQSESAG